MHEFSRNQLTLQRIPDWNMKKENFDKLSNIFRQYNEAEELYTQSCIKDNEQETWERKNDLDSLEELLSLP